MTNKMGFDAAARANPFTKASVSCLFVVFVQVNFLALHAAGIAQALNDHLSDFFGGRLCRIGGKVLHKSGNGQALRGCQRAAGFDGRVDDTGAVFFPDPFYFFRYFFQLFLHFEIFVEMSGNAQFRLGEHRVKRRNHFGAVVGQGTSARIVLVPVERNDAKLFIGSQVNTLPRHPAFAETAFSIVKKHPWTGPVFERGAGCQ
jgi:hypothetical protein